ncbi:hypothetical protein ACFO26_02755 [Lactococcus nasutitermitis]|uniref:Phage protein n=1 Tax=Lactococcus nasutitermitis TaxID=1652957 RepID=A0ABV9JE99_9LACT|nr:hypothetical protein [Lactococcus nasutitermitis]
MIEFVKQIFPFIGIGIAFAVMYEAVLWLSIYLERKDKPKNEKLLFLKEKIEQESKKIA